MIKLTGSINKDEVKLHCSSLHLEDAPCEQGTCHVTTKLSWFKQANICYFSKAEMAKNPIYSSAEQFTSLDGAGTYSLLLSFESHSRQHFFEV